MKTLCMLFFLVTSHAFAMSCLPARLANQSSSLISSARHYICFDMNLHRYDVYVRVAAPTQTKKPINCLSISKLPTDETIKMTEVTNEAQLCAEYLASIGQ